MCFLKTDKNGTHDKTSFCQLMDLLANDFTSYRHVASALHLLPSTLQMFGTKNMCIVYLFKVT